MIHCGYIYFLNIDLDLCLISQVKILESPKCLPLNVDESRDKSKPYSFFFDTVKAFRALENLPVELTFGECDSRLTGLIPMFLAQVLSCQA